MPPAGAGQKRLQRRRVGGVVEHQQPPILLGQGLTGVGELLRLDQIGGGTHAHAQFSERGSERHAVLGRDPPAQLVVVPVAVSIGAGDLRLADPTHAVQRSDGNQRGPLLSRQMLAERGQLSVAADEGAHRWRNIPDPPDLRPPAWYRRT
jgi:hypothetical protein